MEKLRYIVIRDLGYAKDIFYFSTFTEAKDKKELLVKDTKDNCKSKIILAKIQEIEETIVE